MGRHRVLTILYTFFETIQHEMLFFQKNRTFCSYRGRSRTIFRTTVTLSPIDSSYPYFN